MIWKYDEKILHEMGPGSMSKKIFVSSIKKWMILFLYCTQSSIQWKWDGPVQPGLMR